MKSPDKEVERLLEEVSNDPVFKQYAKSFGKSIDLDKLKLYDPRQLIAAARTHEEIIFLSKWLHEEYGGGHSWWTDYHVKRLSLAANPSFYGNDLVTGKGRFAAPMQAVEVVRPGGNPKNLAHRSVQRNLVSHALSYEQLTGQRTAFDIIDNANGTSLKNWTGLSAPALPSNMPKNTIVFDLETTGLLGKQSSIVSLGMSENGVTKGVYANFPQDKTFELFVESKIKPQWQKGVSNLLKSGGAIVSEKQLLESFIFGLESKGDVALMGYNLKSFDIPMLQEVSERYGLSGRLNTALSKTTVIDVAEHAQAYLSRTLGSEYPTWAASEWGTKPLGWQLEAVAKGFGMETAGLAHSAEADVAMTQHIWDKLQAISRGEKVDFHTQNYLAAVKASTGKELLKLKAGMNTLNFAGEILPEERLYQMPFMDYLAEKYPQTAVKGVGQVDHLATQGILEKAKGATSKLEALTSKKIPGVTLGRALSASAAFVGMNMILPGNFWQNSLSVVAFEAARVTASSRGAGGWKGVAIGAGAAAITAVGFNLLSGKDKVSDVEVMKAVGNNEFSKGSDILDTISNLRKAQPRTIEKSGYQGPNPWLNPEYNEAEEVPLYKTMRASKLGVSEEEMYKYMTQEEDIPEFVSATASAGSARHLIEEAKAIASGQAVAAESFLYDPTAQITGHTDITDTEGRPLDYKTVSKKKLEEVRRSGPPEKNIHQLNWYMHMQGASSGVLEYINRENVSDRSSFEVQYNPTMVQEDIAKVQRVRSRVEEEIQAGTLQESLLPKGPSIDTLMTAAEAEKGHAAANISRIGELEAVYQQELDYLESVKSKRGFGSKNAWRDKAAQGGQTWSGKDDAYNTIEGLRHDGIAQHVRHALTDFGSGWLGKIKDFFSTVGRWFKSSSQKNLSPLYGRLSDQKEVLRSAASPIAVDMWKHLGAKGTTAENATQRLESFLAKKNVPVTQTSEEALKRFDTVVAPHLRKLDEQSIVQARKAIKPEESFSIKEALKTFDTETAPRQRQIAEQNIVQTRKVVESGRSHSMVTPSKGYIHLAERDKNVFGLSHEGFEVLHTEKLSRKQFRKETQEDIKTRVKFYAFGGGGIGIDSSKVAHARSQVIKDEAFIGYMQGDDIFKRTKETRLGEISGIRPRSKAELIKEVNTLRTTQSIHRRARESLAYAPELESVDFPESGSLIRYKEIDQFLPRMKKQVREQTASVAEGLYSHKVRQIYEQAPAEAEKLMEKFGLTRGVGNRNLLQEARSTMKRITNFRKISEEAGGVGLRSAHNAGRGHCQSVSNKSSNFNK